MNQRLIICLALVGILAGCSKSPETPAPGAPVAPAAPKTSAAPTAPAAPSAPVVSTTPVTPAVPTIANVPDVTNAPVVAAAPVVPSPVAPPVVAEKTEPDPSPADQLAATLQGAAASASNNVGTLARNVVGAVTNTLQIPSSLTNNSVGKSALDLLGGVANSSIPNTAVTPGTPVVSSPAATTFSNALNLLGGAANPSVPSPSVIPSPVAPVTPPPPTGTFSAAVANLSVDQVTRGLKEALGKGLDHAVASLGKPGGFLTNVNVRILLPEKLQIVEKTLRAVGQGQYADQCVTTMNQAAEQAVPAAAAVFVNSLKNMSLADAKAILNGAPDAATQFFRRTTEAELTQKFLPIVRQAMTKCGATAAYSDIMDKAKVVSPLFSNPSLDINVYVTTKAMDGLFKIVAEEEKSIRKNPVARSTDLLKAVFGAVGK